jgi:hypothetical protein
MGCAAYVSLLPAGKVVAPETRFIPSERQEAPALPATIDPGSYVARFRLVAVSDTMLSHAGAFIEETMAYCETPVEVAGQSAVEISVSFTWTSCTASVRYRGSVGASG